MVAQPVKYGVDDRKAAKRKRRHPESLPIGNLSKHKGDFLVRIARCPEIEHECEQYDRVLGIHRMKITWLNEAAKKNNWKLTAIPMEIEVYGKGFNWGSYQVKDLSRCINKAFQKETGYRLSYLAAWIEDEVNMTRLV